MRTATNSVLSVSPEALSKSTKTPASSQEGGRVFADDFSKAKEVLVTKKASSSEQTSASHTANSSKSVENTVTPGQKVLNANVENAKANSSEQSQPTVAVAAGNEQSVKVTEGGNNLQSAGVESPVAKLIGDKNAVDSAVQPVTGDLLSVDGQVLGKGSLRSELAAKDVKAEMGSALNSHTVPLSKNVPLMDESFSNSASLVADQLQADGIKAASQKALNDSESLLEQSKLASGVAQAGAVQHVTDAKTVLSESEMSNGVGSDTLISLNKVVGEAPLTDTFGQQGVSLPSKTEVAKGIEVAQSLESSAQSVPPASSLLVSPSLDEVPIQGKGDGAQGLVAAGGASLLAMSQAELDAANTASADTKVAIEAANIVSADAKVAIEAADLQQGLLDEAQLNISANAQQDASQELVETAKAAAIATESADVSDGAVAGSALGLAALSVFGGEKETKASSKELDGKSDPQLAVEDSTLLDVAEEGELSWVLSQMQSPVEAKAQLNVAGAAMAATAVAASAVGGDKQKQVNQMTSLGSPEGSKALNVSQSPVFLNGGDLPPSGSDKTSKFTDMMGDNGVLLNEPVELRKKEQDAMIGRMAGQFDSASAATKGELDTGGMNSSLNSNNISRLPLGAGAVNLQTPNGQANLAMNLPPNHPGWANEMSQKVAWVARDGGHTAHIRLDPPELGSLTVKVSVDQDSNTQVSFVAATPQARDLLESQMSRLRDMLAQQGMDLSHVDVDVSQQDTSGTQDRELARDNIGKGSTDMLVGDEVEGDLPLSNVSYTSATGIDYYA